MQSISLKVWRACVPRTQLLFFSRKPLGAGAPYIAYSELASEDTAVMTHLQGHHCHL